MAGIESQREPRANQRERSQGPGSGIVILLGVVAVVAMLVGLIIGLIIGLVL